MNIGKEVAVMRRMTVAELRGKYADVFGEQTRCRHKDYLVRRIAWRLQANLEGDLSERARKRAAELAEGYVCRHREPGCDGQARAGGRFWERSLGVRDRRCRLDWHRCR